MTNAEYSALLARALALPDLRASLRDQLKHGYSMEIPYDVKEELIAELFTTVLARHEATAPELQRLLRDLGFEVAFMSEPVQALVGAAQRRDAVIAKIIDAFPPHPLEDGNPIRFAYLEDELAFREVPQEEWEQARAAAITTSWLDVPDAELDQAFTHNSVFVFLDDAAVDFYLPACLRYAMRERGDCEFYTYLTFVKMRVADARERWTLPQCRAIAAFLEYITLDEPTLGIAIEHKETLTEWLLLISGIAPQVCVLRSQINEWFLQTSGLLQDLSQSVVDGAETTTPSQLQPQLLRSLHSCASLHGPRSTGPVYGAAFTGVGCVAEPVGSVVAEPVGSVEPLPVVCAGGAFALQAIRKTKTNRMPHHCSLCRE